MKTTKNIVPDGWQLMPIIPTQKMIDATWNWNLIGPESYNARNNRIYREMLLAAPAAPLVADTDDNEQFKLMVERGTKAWANVPDDWLGNLRGDPDPQATVEQIDIANLIYKHTGLNSQQTPDEYGKVFALCGDIIANYQTDQVAPQATVEVMRSIIKDALSGFSCTQIASQYPADHWSQRATALLATPPTSKEMELDLVTVSKMETLREKGMRQVGVVMADDSSKRATIDMGKVLWNESTSKADTGKVPGQYGDVAGTFADKTGRYSLPKQPDLACVLLSRWLSFGIASDDADPIKLARYLISDTEAFLAPTQCTHPSWKAVENGKHECEICGSLGRELRYLSVDAAAPSTIKAEQAPDKHPSALSIAGIARKHFGSPIPPAAYAFASELIAATLATVKAEPTGEQ